LLLERFRNVDHLFRQKLGAPPIRVAESTAAE